MSKDLKDKLKCFKWHRVRWDVVCMFTGAHSTKDLRKEEVRAISGTDENTYIWKRDERKRFRMR